MSSLYRWQTKCAMCRIEFANPIKLLICELIICGECKKKKSVRDFIYSKKCTHYEEINLE